jgi:hypothetical protein
MAFYLFNNKLIFSPDSLAFGWHLLSIHLATNICQCDSNVPSKGTELHIRELQGNDHATLPHSSSYLLVDSCMTLFF